MNTINKPKERFQNGATSLYACQYDQRFSYCAYIPNNFEIKEPWKHPLLVVIHGTERAAQQYRDEFKDFSERTGAVIFAPLFPGGIGKRGELNSYKRIKYGETRFDLILLEMIREFSEMYGIAEQKFLLFGFSGGGQFVHRFYYLHPDRLLGVSIASPGNVTLLDNNLDWFIGIRDFQDQFGTPILWDSLCGVPVQLLIGSEDNQQLVSGEDNPFWVPGVELAGNSRLQRIQTLKEKWSSLGIQVQYKEIQGIAHEGFKLTPYAKDFFEDILKRKKELKSK